MICGHLVTSDNEARIIYCNAALKAFKEAKEDATALDEDRTDSEREALQEWYQQDERTRGAAPYQSPEDFEYREVVRAGITICSTLYLDGQEESQNQLCHNCQLVITS